MKVHIACKLLKLETCTCSSEVNKAWRRQMLIHHPDHNKSNKHSIVMTKALHNARKILLSECNKSVSKAHQHNYFYPFNSIQQEYLFWDNVIKGLQPDDIFT